MKYRATSYAEMGTRLKEIVIEAPNHGAAVNHPDLRTLPAGSMAPTGKRVQVIGLKVMR